MTTKKYMLICVALIVAGFILAPVTTGGVTSDERTMSFSVDTFLPVILSLVAFGLAAVVGGVCIFKLGDENAVMLNPLLPAVGLGGFGLFYGLYVVYSDAAKVLDNYYNTWVVNFGPDSEVELHMPEYAEKFKSTANTYMLLMLAAVAVIGVGGYMLYKNWKAAEE